MDCDCNISGNRPCQYEFPHAPFCSLGQVSTGWDCAPDRQASARIGAASVVAEDSHQDAGRDLNKSNDVKLVHLTGEGSNTVFGSMDEWERHLAQVGLDGLRCGHERPKPKI